MKLIRTSILALAACAVAAPCNAQEPEPAFTVNITGGTQARFAGRAVSCPSDRPGDTRTLVVLQQGERHLLMTLPSPNPAPGEYAVAPDPTRTLVVYGSDWRAGPGTYAGTAGMVRITSASAGRLTGTVAVDATELQGRTRARIEATFTTERVGRMARGRCDEQAGAESAGQPPAAPAALPSPGTFKGQLGYREANTPLAGEAAFCVHAVDGVEVLSLRMTDRAGGVAWVRGLPPRAGYTPVSPRGATVWLKPNGNEPEMRPNGGFVIIHRFSAAGVTGIVRAVHRPETGAEEGWWHFDATVNAAPGDCRS